jgi:hypothetical protein
MRTPHAAPFPEGCTLTPPECEAVAIVEAGARHYEATKNEPAPTSALLAVVVALAGCFVVMSIFTGRTSRPVTPKGSHQ